jgi:hypothetical protein
MYLLCIHIEYVLVHDSIRWDLTWPQSISPTNQSCATRKDASGCVGVARAALVARGRREPCRGHSWASRGHAGRAAHEGSSAMLGTKGEPAGEDAIGPPRGLAASRHAGRVEPPGAASLRVGAASARRRAGAELVAPGRRAGRPRRATALAAPRAMPTRARPGRFVRGWSPRASRPRAGDASRWDGWPRTTTPAGHAGPSRRRVGSSTAEHRLRNGLSEGRSRLVCVQEKG